MLAEQILFRQHQPENQNISPKIKTSAQKSKHQPENQNISPKIKTSARKSKHQPENQNISPKIKTSARKSKHQPENQNISPKTKTSAPLRLPYNSKGFYHQIKGDHPSNLILILHV